MSIRQCVLTSSLGLSFLLMGPASVSAAEIKEIAIVTPEEGKDFGWNQQGVEGARQAAQASGLKFVAAQGMGYGDVRPTLRDLADDGTGLVIAHAAGYTSEAVEIAREANMRVAISDPAQVEPGAIADYTLSGGDGGYLAGWLAARMSKTGILGVVVSAESPDWNAQSAGFAMGAKAANPSISLRYAVIGPNAYSDVAAARRVTESVIASGADIIFGQGDGSSFGMIQAVETVPSPSGNIVWFIDVIGDKSSLDKGHLLSSVLWNFEPIFSRMIKDIKNDTFATHGYDISLADNSLSLLKTTHIPDAIWTQVMAQRDAIIAKRITVQRVDDALAVRTLMTQK